MNTLKGLRTALATALTPTTLTVVDHLPERLPTPAALIAAGSPYLESGDTFGAYKVRFTLILVCAQGTNETATDDLDDHVTATLVALDHAGWAIDRVDQPRMYTHANATHLSATVDVARTVHGITDGRP